MTKTLIAVLAGVVLSGCAYRPIVRAMLSQGRHSSGRIGRARCPIAHMT